MQRSWYSWLAWGLLAGLCLISGCGPAVPDKELGKVLDHVPKLPGMDEKYPLRYVPPNPNAVHKTKTPPAPPKPAPKITK